MNKFEYRNAKQYLNSKNKMIKTKMEEKATKRYDLEERTEIYAKDVRSFVKKLKMTLANREDARQLVNASGSVGANYIEANEAISKRDFAYRIKICRKEAKESGYFLRLIDTDDDNIIEKERTRLVQEATELTKIFGAILRKTE